MLYKFKSKASSDVIMLESTARQVLRAMGREPDAKGILTLEQLPPAIAALQAAVEKEEADLRQARAQALEKGEDPPKGPEIGLRQKAWPMVDLMSRSLREEEPVYWGA